MEGAQPWQVTLFLVQFKDFAQNQFVFSERESSLNTISNLSITVEQAKEEILGLTCDDYWNAPRLNWRDE
jgi:hypothetical protein